MNLQSQDLEIAANANVNKMNTKQRQRLLIEIILDFAKNTTLHGLRYITEKGISAMEKLFWVFTFLLSVTLCVLLIHNVWVKWKTSPVIVTLSEHLVSVAEVPFPAVTICPHAKIKQSYYNYTEKYIKDQTIEISSPEDKDPLNIDIYQNVCLLCSQYLIVNSSLPIDVHVIFKVVPEVNDVFDYCFWQGNKIDCGEIFTPAVTEEGICFTFNSLNTDEIFREENLQDEYSYIGNSLPKTDWSLERGYFSSERDVYPRRGRGKGVVPDLEVFLFEIWDRDILCDGPLQGSKVYLHHPADMPQSSLYYYAAPPEQISSFALEFSLMNTSDSLANYSPLIRQCYFPSERQLKFFRIYTSSNCRLECLSNFTLKHCGCVWFHMPHDKGTVICKKAQEDCVSEALDAYATEEGMTDNNASFCQCLPSCASVQYEAELLRTKYDKKGRERTAEELQKAIEFAKPDQHWSSANWSSKIEMYFKEPRYVSMRRSELFGLTDFLANCGGLLGLFLGFSFLSLVEIFYFLTLRLCCKFRREQLLAKKIELQNHNNIESFEIISTIMSK